MGTKAENTKEFILEKVSPIFNQKGYVGTSLSDITKATQLTKGAIYGNFENKEDLALHAFKHNIKRIIHPLNHLIATKNSYSEKLYAITEYYRGYFQLAKSRGGCPVLNMGTDAKNLNPALYQSAKDVSVKLISGIEGIIKTGQKTSEFKMNIDARVTARNMYSIIEGGIFSALTNEDESFLLSILDHIDQNIILKLKS
jgi:AcrR family transcriptional regulator